MMEQTVFDLIFTFFLVYLGWKLKEWHMTFTVFKMLNERIEREHGIDIAKLSKIDTDTINEIMFLEVEKVNDLYLVYDKTNNEFICQGNSIDDAAVKFTERREKTLGTFTIDEKKFYFYNGLVKNEMPEK